MHKNCLKSITKSLKKMQQKFSIVFQSKRNFPWRIKIQKRIKFAPDLDPAACEPQCILTQMYTYIHRYPYIADVFAYIHILQCFGCVEWIRSMPWLGWRDGLFGSEPVKSTVDLNTSACWLAAFACYLSFCVCVCLSLFFRIFLHPWATAQSRQFS